MLKALRLAIKNNSSVFGLNKGHIGFLMNKINKTNLNWALKGKEINDVFKLGDFLSRP